MRLAKCGHRKASPRAAAYQRSKLVLQTLCQRCDSADGDHVVEFRRQATLGKQVADLKDRRESGFLTERQLKVLIMPARQIAGAPFGSFAESSQEMA